MWGKGGSVSAVPCGTTSALAISGQKHGCETLDGSVVQDDLVVEPMGAGLDLTARRPSEDVVEPGGGGHLVGVWLNGSRTRLGCSCDLGFECAD